VSRRRRNEASATHRPLQTTAIARVTFVAATARVVDDARRPTGVIALSDVLAAIATRSLPGVGPDLGVGRLHSFKGSGAGCRG
jgi:hypothetical protein